MLVQRLVVEETERSDGNADRTGRQFLLRRQINLVSSNLSWAECFRRPAEMTSKDRNLAHVSFLSQRCEIPHLHVLNHALSKWCYRSSFARWNLLESAAPWFRNVRHRKRRRDVSEDM